MARPNRRLLEIEAKIAQIKPELDRFQEAARKREANVTYPTAEYWRDMIRQHLKYLF